MNAPLPDVSLTDIAPTLRPLQWVGMQSIDIPVTLEEVGYRRELHARADVQVNLPTPHIKGIHMSRLYQLLDKLSHGMALSPARLHELLEAMIDSHHDCHTQSARLRLNVDLLVRRPALVTQGLSGWKSYPLRIDAELIDGTFHCQLRVRVDYSSTCPCSAALSRQLIANAFLQEFGRTAQVEPSVVASWLQQFASLATPHSQRSEAEVTVSLPSDAEMLGALKLIECIEHAVGTPVQTAVKRADEQEFAALNGQNLMFVEDAARRIEAALFAYTEPQVHVRHLESLHPHDAVAWTMPA
ncbi:MULTISPECIES: GTP cyclohydrolase FolE2 [Nitrincola]|uniref:GTP cyclohydrolase FolE2 n=1 Tax=Nitrincola nitratireducens TaxID=1229521 RepID=W9V324_9GAMM|nr:MULTISPECIES: GTP cyclohydrolase FolE2 [Nitrincola]EXJ11311.1 GTP cyclohydrolase folE2 [Nitrincola nitratireducens]